MKSYIQKLPENPQIFELSMTLQTKWDIELIMHIKKVSYDVAFETLKKNNGNIVKALEDLDDDSSEETCDLKAYDLVYEVKE